MTTFNEDLDITGALFAGNIAWGRVIIEPEPKTPTSIEVTGLNLRGTGKTTVQVTTATAGPWSLMREATVDHITPTGFTIWVWRRNDSDAYVRWIALRKP